MEEEKVQAPEPQKPSGYEFTAAQNATIDGLAKRMKFIGGIYLAFGILVGIGALWMLTQSLPSAVVGILEVVMFIFMGIWTAKAAKSFEMIVQTKGNDISFLMTALEELRKIYNLQVWLFIIVLGILAIGIVVMVVMML